ncbi:MAG TPA: tetratricopeptide repeat protein, partial [Actinomycetota bacterium]|nr:tetratricopeptide repeat protein [Actinomycetota bacterium]
DSGSLAWSTESLAAAALALGDLTQARDLARTSLKITVGARGPRFASFTTRMLGMVLCHLGAYDEADDTLRESLRLAREYDDQGQLVPAALALAALYASVGRRHEAEDLGCEAVEAARESGNRSLLAGALSEVAVLWASAGDAGSARRSIAEAMSIHAQVPMAMPAHFLSCSKVEALAGDASAARARAVEALSASAGLGIFDAVRALERIARIDAQQGRFRAAAVLMGASAGFRDRSSQPLLPFPAEERVEAGRAEAQVRDALGADEFEAAWSQGESMSLPEAATLASDAGVVA